MTTANLLVKFQHLLSHGVLVHVRYFTLNWCFVLLLQPHDYATSILLQCLFTHHVMIYWEGKKSSDFPEYV